MTMKQYKVEARTYYSKISLNKQHIIESSMPEIQQIMDNYAADGWSLVSTDAANFGLALYIYLYFEKE